MTGPNGDIVIQTSRVSKSFPGVRALKDLDFEIRRGEVHALVGENGAGKSTLMKILVREYLEDGGRIVIDGRDVTPMGIQEVQALGLSLIHQDLNLVDMFSVAHNICLGQEPTTGWGTIDWPAMRRKARKYLKEITAEIEVETKVEDLSISQKQLVAIARALVTEPRFLILDEPTARLDQKSSEELFSFLDRAREKGLTIIYISHRLEEIYRICDRITVFRDGRKIITSPTVDLPQAELVQRMVGREIKEQVPKDEAVIGEVALAVEKLKPETVCQEVSLEVRSGEIVGLVGSIGSGKSELARAIFGADKRKRGRILIKGREVHINKPSDAISSGLALVPEERRSQGLIGVESVRKNTTLVTLKKLFSSFGLWIRQSDERNEVQKTIDGLKIATPGTEYEVQFLSGGTQQKVVVGKWLMSRASVYIFDEPTKGIDVGGKHEIYKLIISLAKEGAGILFISNELPEVLPLSDRILVMFNGRIIKELEAGKTDRQELLFYVMGGKEYDATNGSRTNN